jgi:hypothetical protein
MSERIKPLKWECDARSKEFHYAFTSIGRYEVEKRQKWGWSCSVFVNNIMVYSSDHKTDKLAKARAEQYHEGIVRGLLA